MEEGSSVRKRHAQPQSLANGILELSKTSDEIESALLLTWDQIEEWQQDNEFIMSSYRPVSKSYIRSLESLRYLHNQSVNIYSHLLPAIACIPVAVYLNFIVAPRYSSADYLDTFVFAMFFTGAIFCFGVSAFFHTIGNHSYDVYHSWLLIDLLGILALTAGSFYPGVYYGFYCEPHIFSTYWIMITLAAGGCTTFCGVPKFRSPQYRKVRAFLFASLAMLGVIPMAHAALKFGVVQAQRQMGWWYFVLEGIFFTLGVVIYASRVPERFSPGTFDVWGSSHQVFHAFVFMGVVSHLLGVVKAFDYTHDPLTRRCQRSLMYNVVYTTSADS